MFTHEIIHFDERMPVKLFLQRVGSIPLHWHESLEILMVLTGRVTVQVDNERFVLHAEDVIVINPHQRHATEGEDCVLATLQILPSLFEEYHPDDMVFGCCSVGAVRREPFDAIRSLLSRLIIRSTQAAEITPAAWLLTKAYLCELMYQLMQHFRVRPDSIAHPSSEVLGRLKDITGYIMDHYRENITLKDVAQRQYLTVPYLSAFFEKNMGVTFTRYLTSLRLDSAYAELMTTDHRIDDISSDNGFPNTRSFVSAFRRQYGMLPSRYRTENAGEGRLPDLQPDPQGSLQNYMKIEKNDYLAVLKKYAEVHTDVPEEEPPVRRLQVSADLNAEYTPLRHTFHVFTSVGRAKELLYATVRKCLEDLQGELHFRYIKFHGILDDSMMLYREDRTGAAVYNYVYVDEVLDYLLSIGLKPLVQLSFMPAALASDPRHTEFARPVIISRPKDSSRWTALITALTDHLLIRYGREEVSSWIFTFWNEPFGNTPFRFGDSETVFSLYAQTRQAVKSCCPSLVFASPSLLPEVCDDVLHDFFDYCEKHDCLPDCYLIHAYQTTFDALSQAAPGQTPIGGHIVLSDDPDEFRRQIAHTKELLKPLPAAPIYLTEWNFSSSHRDWLNDTCFRSAFIARNILQNYDALDSFGLWTLCDLIEELTPGVSPFHGGIGLYTRDGIPKPARLVLSLLGGLLDRCIARGDGYFVTTDGRGRLSVILYNYQPFSSLYAKGILIDSSPDTRYEVCPDLGIVHVSCRLSGVTQSAYTVTEHILNRKYGSAFDIWQRMGGTEPLTAAEKKQLEHLCRPALTRRRLTPDNGSLSYHAFLQPHEVRLAEFDPYPHSESVVAQ